MMRKWIAGKLVDLAVWLDCDAVMIAPKKKIGRPLGSKDKSPRNKANMGRPKGSKSKPKVQS
jgi:hypothetical protein